MTNRSPTAVLSPVELTALRHIADGRMTDVNVDCLQVLFAMGLVALDPDGRASLTIDGRERLRGAPAEQATK
jgi:hypothetical protein